MDLRREAGTRCRMPISRRQEPPKKGAAKRKGEALRSRSRGETQPAGRRRAKAKPKPEVEPARRIAGVRSKAKPRVMDARDVTLSSLAVGRPGGVVINVDD